MARLDLSSRASVAVMKVFEFDDLPHICVRDYPGVLRSGAVYVRPRRAPETVEIASSVEMRELLDLATEKSVRRFLATAERAGVRVSAQEHDDAAKAFEAESERAW